MEKIFSFEEIQCSGIPSCHVGIIQHKKEAGNYLNPECLLMISFEYIIMNVLPSAFKKEIENKDIYWN